MALTASLAIQRMGARLARSVGPPELPGLRRNVAPAIYRDADGNKLEVHREAVTDSVERADGAWVDVSQKVGETAVACLMRGEGGPKVAYKRTVVVVPDTRALRENTEPKGAPPPAAPLFNTKPVAKQAVCDGWGVDELWFVVSWNMGEVVSSGSQCVDTWVCWRDRSGAFGQCSWTAMTVKMTREDTGEEVVVATRSEDLYCAYDRVESDVKSEVVKIYTKQLAACGVEVVWLGCVDWAKALKAGDEWEDKYPEISFCLCNGEAQGVGPHGTDVFASQGLGRFGGGHLCYAVRVSEREGLASWMAVDQPTGVCWRMVEYGYDSIVRAWDTVCEEKRNPTSLPLKLKATVVAQV